MGLFRPRNLLILAAGGTAVAIVLSKKNQPADPLPTVSYTPPSSPATAVAKEASDDSGDSGDTAGSEASESEPAEA